MRTMNVVFIVICAFLGGLMCGSGVIMAIELRLERKRRRNAGYCRLDVTRGAPRDAGRGATRSIVEQDGCADAPRV